MSATSSGRICEWQSAIGYAVVTFDHIAPRDATEIFAKLQWYDIRNTGFDWTRFPLHIRSARKLTLNETPLVTVIGKAFWDVGRAPKDQSNRRKRPRQYAVWEIHPVMKLHVVHQIAERTLFSQGPA